MFLDWKISCTKRTGISICMQQSFQSALFWTLMISCSYFLYLFTFIESNKDLAEKSLWIYFGKEKCKKPSEEEGDAVATQGYFSGLEALANDFFSPWICLSFYFQQWRGLFACTIACFLPWLFAGCFFLRPVSIRKHFSLKGLSNCPRLYLHSTSFICLYISSF